ncbi:MAG: hypothetical protein P1P76_12580, partial [Anaerolineales bacterium]|nr:hypothetical protein [Anaerolineales bacterium]
NQVRDFFGSWFQIEGRSQTGYYLGHEIIRRLEKSNSLEEIAGLDDIELRILQTTEEIAGLGA